MMHPLSRIRPSSAPKLLASSRSISSIPLKHHSLKYSPTSSLQQQQQQQQQQRPYSHGGYGDGTGDPRAENPAQQGEVDSATEKIEHPGTKPTKPSKPSSQQQQQEEEGSQAQQPSHGKGSEKGKPTMRDDWNDVSNEATNVPPERQSEDVRRHNEEVVDRHDREVGRDRFGGREK